MKRSIWRSRSFILLSAVLLLLIWQLAALIVDASILLPTPLEVFGQLAGVFSSSDHWADLWATIVRSLESFVLIVALSLLFGLLIGESRDLQLFFKPLLAVIRATPVMALILLAFIWFKTGTVPIFSALLMGFPVMYENIITGFSSRSPELLEFARVYGLDRRQVLREITIPSLMPYIIAGSRGALGMTWKVVIAAEVLTVPPEGIGSAMQYAQINLETSEVMAWTVIAIILTALSDALFSLAARLMGRRRSL